MSEFLYLYRISRDAQREAMGTPGHAEHSLKVWMTWMRELDQGGHLKSPGQPLEMEGKVVGRKQRAGAGALHRSARPCPARGRAPLFRAMPRGL